MKLRGEVQKKRRHKHGCNKQGVKHLSKAIGDQQAKALMCVARDQDTEDGGKKGQLTSNPTDIDAVVRRAWDAVYQGIGGCIERAVVMFLDKHARFSMKAAP